MPLYEYSCQKCGTYEVRQKFSDAPLTECRTCGGPVQKLISQTAFSLKGGGWYQQGYGSNSSSSPASCSSSSGEGCSGCPKAASNE